jgi:hypothetical protein
MSELQSYLTSLGLSCHIPKLCGTDSTAEAVTVTVAAVTTDTKMDTKKQDTDKQSSTQVNDKHVSTFQTLFAMNSMTIRELVKLPMLHQAKIVRFLAVWDLLSRCGLCDRYFTHFVEHDVTIEKLAEHDPSTLQQLFLVVMSPADFLRLFRELRFGAIPMASSSTASIGASDASEDGQIVHVVSNTAHSRTTIFDQQLQSAIKTIDRSHVQTHDLDNMEVLLVMGDEDWKQVSDEANAEGCRRVRARLAVLRRSARFVLNHIGMAKYIDPFAKAGVTTMEAMVILPDDSLAQIVASTGHRALLRQRLAAFRPKQPVVAADADKNADMVRPVASISELLVEANSVAPTIPDTDHGDSGSDNGDADPHMATEAEPQQ